MIDIDWNVFRANNKNYRSSFEDLCYHLFCREHRVADGVKADFNHTGLETDPVACGAKIVGFQSKFFEGSVDYGQIEESFNKALILYKGRITSILIYLNCSPPGRSKVRDRIEKNAKKSKVSIVWIVPSHFKILLNKPSNLDLAEFYFGAGDILGFIRNSTRPAYQTLIDSEQFISLKVTCDSTQIFDLKATLLKNRNKTSLLIGAPGSGKSIFTHKLFSDFAALKSKSVKVMLKEIGIIQGVPIVVDLKNCAIASLESILAGRKGENKVNGTLFKFIYLFDGLDELTEESADTTLCYMRELADHPNTLRILISCRRGNGNRFRAKSYFDDIVEFQVDFLTKKDIKSYFDGRNEPTKSKLLAKLAVENPFLLDEIKDVLFIRLLWETIARLEKGSTLLDLLNLKVSHLLGSPNHRKLLASLNLPNPKEQEIIAINENISVEFQNSFQFRFPLKELQKLVLSQYERIDYNGVNEVIAYLASVFFDHVNGEQDNSPTYIYQHRRYQEYFYIRHLRHTFEKHPKSLRSSGILASKDLFNKLFLSYMRRVYEQSQDICGVIGLNLIETYLGQYQGHGVDNAYYLNSKIFPKALAIQSDGIFVELTSDPHLEFEEKILIDIRTQKEKLDRWNVYKNDYYAEQYLKDIWNEGLTEAISIARYLHQHGKTSAAGKVRANLVSSINLFKEYEFEQHFTAPIDLQDPFWGRYEDSCYLKVVVDGISPRKYLKNTIRKCYSNIVESRGFDSGPSQKEKLLIGLFKICLADPNKYLLSIIDELDDYEMQVLVGTAVSIDFLHVVIADVNLSARTKEILNDSQGWLPQYEVEFLFLKKVFSLEISEKEKKSVEKYNEILREKRDIDWRYRHLAFSFAMTNYLLERFTFKSLGEGAFRYYNERTLYAALFHSYLDLILGRVTLGRIMREFQQYNNNSQDGTSPRYLHDDISRILSEIIIFGFRDDGDVQLLRAVLFSPENKLSVPTCLYNIRIKSPSLFKQIINKSDLASLEQSLSDWQDDFPSFVDRCFELSVLYSDLDHNRAKQHLLKGVVDGILRHGWRKDILVSYFLIDALDIIWLKNYLDLDSLKEATEKILDLAVRVTKITDGDHTWQGPYNLLRVVAKFDVSYAEKLREKLHELEYRDPSNMAATIILFAKIRVGASLKEIKQALDAYKTKYDHRGEPRREGYEEKFQILVAVAKSPLYSEEDAKEAFDDAYKVVEEFKRLKDSYGFTDDDLLEEKVIYRELCIKYDKNFNLEFDKKEEVADRYIKYSEDEFLSRFESAKSKEAIQELFTEFKHHDNNIIVKKKANWEKIVENTFRVCGNAQFFFDFLRANNFPQTSSWYSNSAYLHFGLAAVLKKPSLRHDTFEYLKQGTGHGGFLNMIRTYAENDDQSMCLKLFNKYIQYSELLVY